ncbi:Uncharacterised protein [Mycobacteroides abscessus subsp. massiliense]|nr:Uncharacterised protein [Mycobacteroides abscessus subsp. massiliense]SKU11869.1 Uncharacterised protein [Mycobacteroides abscessus subsp. massiliense]
MYSLSHVFRDTRDDTFTTPSVHTTPEAKVLKTPPKRVPTSRDSKHSTGVVAYDHPPTSCARNTKGPRSVNAEPVINTDIFKRLFELRYRFCTHAPTMKPQLSGREDRGQARNGDRPPRAAPLPQTAKQFQHKQGIPVTGMRPPTSRPSRRTSAELGLRHPSASIRKLPASPVPGTLGLAPGTIKIVRLHLEGKSTGQMGRVVGGYNNKALTTTRDYRVTQTATES